MLDRQTQMRVSQELEDVRPGTAGCVPSVHSRRGLGKFESVLQDSQWNELG